MSVDHNGWVFLTLLKIFFQSFFVIDFARFKQKTLFSAHRNEQGAITFLMIDRVWITHRHDAGHLVCLVFIYANWPPTSSSRFCSEPR